jgi:predicted SAM-dependent methyltransferase
MSLTNIRRLARWVYRRLAYRNQISAYLRASEQPRLNLGCGQNILPGWMNVDLEGGRHGSIFMDATRPWPLPDNTFDAILCEHMIEHVPKDTGRHILSEGFRVLKPTARIRVVTPDLSSMAQLILDPMCPAFNSYLKFVAAFHSKSHISSGDAINYLFYHYGHRYIYTTAELRRHFEEVGFRQTFFEEPKVTRTSWVSKTIHWRHSPSRVSSSQTHPVNVAGRKFAFTRKRVVR